MSRIPQTHEQARALHDLRKALESLEQKLDQAIKEKEREKPYNQTSYLHSAKRTVAHRE